MTVSDSNVTITSGAIFRRADLHIHSLGPKGSYDVTDVLMTPEKIVDTAISEQLNVISITDHNSVGNVEAAVAHAEGKELLVIPGVELSTSQGHLLTYFSTYDQLNHFMGNLTISADYKMCEHSIYQCLEIASRFDGVGIAAHIETATGFEEICKSNIDSKEQILLCPNLLALEISNIDSEEWYTNLDSNNERKTRFRRRCDKVAAGDEKYELAKIMSSDSHQLESFCRNAQEAKRLTRIKMGSLCFESFCAALLDPAARIRIKE